jgi:hypothetical protein
MEDISYGDLFAWLVVSAAVVYGIVRVVRYCRYFVWRNKKTVIEPDNNEEELGI